ncbi:hypothetical protein [Streptomyces sp. NPDC046887]|uniref:hypothetical protein n=1 Tax=Streptomyces sp. NPDC046887 TaxID=3155472 RepID=UPI0033F1DCC8
MMEGACDREARRITRETAVRAGLREPDDLLARLAFRDSTGALTEEDMTDGPEADSTSEAARYVEALRHYQAAVNGRYETFLGEFAPGEKESLHDLLLTAVISGDVRGLSAWLDDRHGPGTFAGAFQTGTYFAPVPGPRGATP